MGGHSLSQPPLSSLEAFQVLGALALIAGTTEVEFLDVFIVAQFEGGAVDSVEIDPLGTRLFHQIRAE
jgi:hypothetical protein